MRKSKSAIKVRRRQPLQMSQLGSNSVQQINVVSPISGDKPDSYFVGKHNGSKVRRIAKRIHELAFSADPEMRN